MGWLFGSKKVPKVPFPPGRPVDEKALRFPSAPAGERVIQPEQVKQAVGMGQPFELSPELPSTPVPAVAAPPAPARSSPLLKQNAEPLFIKVELYRRVLGEIDTIRGKINELTMLNKHLESSEYNEEYHFDRMKQAVKIMHDRLLQMDKVIFKT